MNYQNMQNYHNTEYGYDNNSQKNKILKYKNKPNQNDFIKDDYDILKILSNMKKENPYIIIKNDQSELNSNKYKTELKNTNTQRHMRSNSSNLFY